MKFLVDAHLPPSLCRLLAEHGHDVVHTGTLPRQNATADREIRSIAITDSRVLITKDLDFFQDLILKGAPPKLVLVRCGNLRKRELLALFERQLSAIVIGLETNDLIELSSVG